MHSLLYDNAGRTGCQFLDAMYIWSAGQDRKWQWSSIDNVDPSHCGFQVWCCSLVSGVTACQRSEECIHCCTSLLVLQATLHGSRWELFLLFLNSNYCSIVRNNKHQPSLALFPDPAQLFCRLQFIRAWESGFCIILLGNCSRYSHQKYSEIHNQRDQDLVNVQCDPSVPEAAKSAISDIHQTDLGSIPMLQNLTVVCFRGATG